MATMRDVAERANVSIATVSFVVNHTKRVSPETTARIHQAMKELGFRRNAVARALASRRTRMLALLFPAFEHHLSGTVLEFVTSAAVAAGERGYTLLVWPISNDADQLTELLADGLVDGVVLMEVQMEDARVDRLVETGVPFAMIGRIRDSTGLPFVDVHFERTTIEALDHLTQLGHRRIALVLERLDESSPLLGYGPHVRVQQTYQESMAARGLDPVVVLCEATPGGGVAATDELLAVAPDTTAVVVMNEQAAVGIVNRYRHVGVRIPDEVSVLSIGSSERMGAMTDPRLTTMNAPGTELGRLGVDALIDQLEGLVHEVPQVLIDCTPPEGESVAPPPATAVAPEG